jgi:hypothetical protein
LASFSIAIRAMLSVAQNPSPSKSGRLGNEAKARRDRKLVPRSHDRGVSRTGTAPTSTSTRRGRPTCGPTPNSKQHCPACFRATAGTCTGGIADWERILRLGYPRCKQRSNETAKVMNDAPFQPCLVWTACLVGRDTRSEAPASPAPPGALGVVEPCARYFFPGCRFVRPILVPSAFRLRVSFSASSSGLFQVAARESTSSIVSERKLGTRRGYCVNGRTIRTARDR